MFESIAGLVNRRGWLIVLAWLALAGLLAWRAPAWSAVSRDDDVRFFPADYPSVLGQDLLERGFPDNTSSSSVVVVVERRDGPLSRPDLAYADALSAAPSPRPGTDRRPRWGSRRSSTTGRSASAPG